MLGTEIEYWKVTLIIRNIIFKKSPEKKVLGY